MFFVAGLPVPQGSSRAFVVDGKAVVTSSSGQRLADWRQNIRLVAQQHISTLIEGPVEVALWFVLPRAKSSRRSVRWAARRPDLDKLVRAGLDALTGVAYADDAQVSLLAANKVLADPGEQHGVHVSVRKLDERVAYAPGPHE